MFSGASTKSLPLSKLAIHTESPRFFMIPTTKSPVRLAGGFERQDNGWPASERAQLSQSPQLGHQGDNESASPNASHEGPSLSLEETPARNEGEVDKSRKRNAECQQLQPEAKKSKSAEDESALLSGIRADIKAFPSLGPALIKWSNLLEERRHIAFMDCFNPSHVSAKLEKHLAQNIALPDPLLTSFSLRCLGSSRSPLPTLLDAVMLGSADTKGVLPLWSMLEPLPPSPTEKYVYRSALWIKEKGGALGAVSIYYSSDREELLTRQLSGSPARCVQGSPTIRKRSAQDDEEHHGPTQPDCASKVEDQSAPSDLPLLFYCCSSEVVLARHSVNQKIPWRVESPKVVLHELEKASVNACACKALTLVWSVRVVSEQWEEEEIVYMTEAIRQSVQKTLAIHTNLQKILLPVLGAGKTLAKGCCLILLLRGKVDYELTVTSQGLDTAVNYLTQHTSPCVLWPVGRTCSLPFMMLNLWKKEINEEAKPTSETSELVDCLIKGLLRFLALPYWNPDPVDCRILVRLQTVPSEVKTVRKILKKLKKVLGTLIVEETRTLREQEEAKRQLKINTLPAKATDRLTDARKRVRSIIKNGIGVLERQSALTGLMKMKFLLPLPLQLCKTLLLVFTFRFREPNTTDQAVARWCVT